jgi:hypothetical protein
VHCKYISVNIQQEATLHNLFISGNCSTCFGWHFHPSSGANKTVSTPSGICHTVTAICRYRGRVGTGLSVLWVAYTTHSTQTGSNSVWQIPDAVDTVLCPPDDGCKYHPKHVEQFPDINKLWNVASCWKYIGILLGAHPILHISRIRVKEIIEAACTVQQWKKSIKYSHSSNLWTCVVCIYTCTLEVPLTKLDGAISISNLSNDENDASLLRLVI